MIKIKQAIVVEGKYDKNTLSQVVDAPIFQTDGFGIMQDKQQIELLRRVAKLRGLIVFTDSDGAGFVIRNKLKSCIPAEYLLHAYIPDIYGKERRKSAPGKEGKLGVEGMTPQVIIDCLIRAGATIEGERTSCRQPEITKLDMFDAGLSGGPGSSEKRKALMKMLSLPEHMSSNALLQALNLLCTKDEFYRLTDLL
jgi:ribonuclease M5